MRAHCEGACRRINHSDLQSRCFRGADIQTRDSASRAEYKQNILDSRERHLSHPLRKINTAEKLILEFNWLKSISLHLKS